MKLSEWLCAALEAILTGPNLEPHLPEGLTEEEKGEILHYHYLNLMYESQMY